MKHLLKTTLYEVIETLTQALVIAFSQIILDRNTPNYVMVKVRSDIPRRHQIQ